MVGLIRRSSGAQFPQNTKSAAPSERKVARELYSRAFPSPDNGRASVLTPTFRLGGRCRVVRAGFSPESAVFGSRSGGDEAVENFRIMAEADPGLVTEAPP